MENLAGDRCLPSATRIPPPNLFVIFSFSFFNCNQDCSRDGHVEVIGVFNSVTHSGVMQNAPLQQHHLLPLGKLLVNTALASRLLLENVWAYFENFVNFCLLCCKCGCICIIFAACRSGDIIRVVIN